MAVLLCFGPKKQSAMDAGFIYSELAELVLVLVPSSVQDEHMFRHKTSEEPPAQQEQQLTAWGDRCLHREFSLSSFPYAVAIGCWLDATNMHEDVTGCDWTGLQLELGCGIHPCYE